MFLRANPLTVFFWRTLTKPKPDWFYHVLSTLSGTKTVPTLKIRFAQQHTRWSMGWNFTHTNWLVNIVTSKHFNGARKGCPCLTQGWLLPLWLPSFFWQIVLMMFRQFPYVCTIPYVLKFNTIYIDVLDIVWNAQQMHTILLWFGTFFIFPYIGNSNPNWRTHIFQRGRYTTNQSTFIIFHQPVPPLSRCKLSHVDLQELRRTDATWLLTTQDMGWFGSQNPTGNPGCWSPSKSDRTCFGTSPKVFKTISTRRRCEIVLSAIQYGFVGKWWSI